MDAVQTQQDNRQARAEWKAYLKTLNEELPALAARVFALRTKTYMGCGFHYSLEKTLGNLIVYANDHENRDNWSSTKEGVSHRLIVEIVNEQFREDLEKAEASALELAAKHVAETAATVA